MEPERYLARIGVEPARARSPDLETLERLQRSHVTAVPFETLSITGDPFGDRDGEGVSLALSDLYEKVVERRRGGFCYELNGLFGWLLANLGFDVERRSARVANADGDGFGVPADHLTLVVSLDRRYLADVGLGSPAMRRPLPLDGTVREDGVGVEWRAVESDRPDADYRTQYRRPDADEWADRFVFRDVRREMRFFEATCEYHQTALESPFTGDPFVTMGAERGTRTLSVETLTRTTNGEKTKRPVAESEWHDVLEREFGIRDANVTCEEF